MGAREQASGTSRAWSRFASYATSVPVTPKAPPTTAESELTSSHHAAAAIGTIARSIIAVGGSRRSGAAAPRSRRRVVGWPAAGDERSERTNAVVDRQVHASTSSTALSATRTVSMACVCCGLPTCVRSLPWGRKVQSESESASGFC